MVVSERHLMLPFVSNMRVPSMELATMEVFENQFFNEEAKLAHMRIF